MNALSTISNGIELLLGNKIKNILKCYYRSCQYKGLKLRYKEGMLYYYFDDGVLIKSVDFFNENPLVINQGYLKYYSPKNDDVVIDAGAFLGAFCIYLVKKYPKIQIIAFEPSKINCENLKKNLRINNVQKNICVIQKGLWESKSKLLINLSGPSTRINPDLLEMTKNKETISTTDLDSELKTRKIKNVNFIKMDIEGAEIEALVGMKKTLKQKPTLSIASYHIRDREKTYKKVETILESSGYPYVKTGYPKHLTTWAGLK